MPLSNVFGVNSFQIGTGIAIDISKNKQYLRDFEVNE